MEFMADPKMPVASAFSGMFHTAFDGLYFSAGRQQYNRLTTLVGQTVSVKVQRRAGGAVAQERTYRLNIYTQLQQPCGKAVTKGMEMNIRQANRFHEPGKAPLKRARLGSMGRRAENKFASGAGCEQILQLRQQKVRHRQYTV